MRSQIPTAGVILLAVALCAMPASGQELSGFGQATARAQAPAPATTPYSPSAQPATQMPPTGPTKRISVDDAVRMALEQNLTIQVERINPAIQDLSIAQVRSFYTPNLRTTLQKDSTDTPPSSFLSGGQTVISDDTLSTTVGVNQLLPWGGSYSINWNSSRATSTSFFNSFNPVLRSNINAAFTQPLLRNFHMDNVRQQLLITRKNREISDVQVRETVVSTVRNVKNGYWELVYAVNNLATQRQSLELARESLRNNRTRVEVGTMAPIDIVEAEAEVARNEEAVILAEASIQQAQDRLRALIMDPGTPEFWNINLEPTDPPALQTRAIDIDAAVQNALGNRTDVIQAKKQLEANDINIRYFQNQRLPDLNVEATYGLAGLGGTQFEPFDFTGVGTGGPRAVVGQRSFGSVLGNLFSNDFPTWTVGVTVGYPIGRSNAEANLARARLQYSQGQTQIKNLELQVATQVRDVGRQVNTNLKRVDATRAARQLAERRLEAEQKKFAVGMSTSFLVFQAQRDLAATRNNELRAVLDYNRSLVDFEAVQETAIGGGGITIAGANAQSGGTAGTATQPQQQQQQQQR